jgi:hypothetical protein
MLEIEFIFIAAGFLTAINILTTASLYRKLGASLSFRSPDPFTYLFYSQLFLAVIGSYLILLSLDNTDWLTYLDPNDPVRLLGWLIVQYCFIALGCAMLFSKALLLDKRLEKAFFEKLKTPRRHHAENWIILLSLSLICSLAALYCYRVVGYIPALKIFEASGTGLAVVRSDTKLGFQGMSFVRDSFFIGLSQIVALFILSLCLTHPAKRSYRFVLFIAFLCVFFSTTFNLEKGGIVNFVVSAIAMYVYCGNKFSLFRIGLFGLIVFTTVILAYIVTFGDHVDASYLADEISGRILIAQVAGVFMTLSAVPDAIPFVGLTGIRVIADAFGYIQSEGSPRLIMSFFWPKEVGAGLLGFMSSYFPAEAYGNFGFAGVLLAPLVVGLVFICYMSFFMRLHNPHLGAASVVFIIFHLPLTSNFSYFYYSPGLILLAAVIFAIDKICAKIGKNVTSAQ